MSRAGLGKARFLLASAAPGSGGGPLRPLPPGLQVGSARPRRTAAPGATRRGPGRRRRWRQWRRSRTSEERCPRAGERQPVTAGGTGRPGPCRAAARCREAGEKAVGLIGVGGGSSVGGGVRGVWEGGSGNGITGEKSETPWRAPKLKTLLEAHGPEWSAGKPSGKAGGGGARGSGLGRVSSSALGGPWNTFSRP